MASPFESMEAWYIRRATDGQEQFSNKVAWHLRHGYVFTTDRFFVMGRPIKLQPTRDLTDAEIDRKATQLTPDVDCWYFTCLSGNLRGVWHLLPYDLPWMAYHRMVHGKPRLFVRPLAPFRHRSLRLDSSRN